MYEELRKLFNKEYNFEVKDENKAKESLAFVKMALGIESLENIHPDRAGRIYEGALDLIKLTEDEHYIKDHIKEGVSLYREKFRQSEQQYARNDRYSPLEEVAIQLLHDWFDEDVNQFYLPKYGVVNPVITSVIGIILMTDVKFWGKLINEHIIINMEIKNLGKDQKVYSFNKTGYSDPKVIESLYTSKIEQLLNGRKESDLSESEKEINLKLQRSVYYDPRLPDVYFGSEETANTAQQIAERLRRMTQDEFLASSYPYLWLSELNDSSLFKVINKDILTQG